MEDRRKGLLLSACVSIFLLANFIGGAAGDVPDGVVYTDLHKTVQKGKEIVLTCDFYGAPVAVYWKKGDDPDNGADLITWVDGEEISGSCVNNKACHMTDDYSLVIADARIADQGRYICQISNYLGIILYNYTDVKMYAPPKEPYPVIDGCAEKESSGYNSTNPCRILTNATISITCSATNYYPELDLFFLHGSQKMTDIITSENSNIDETKNTSISIKAIASKTPYVCVASGITGSKDQRAATIFVESSTAIPTTTANERSPTPFTSNTATTKISTGNRAAEIVVPIFVIIVIGAVAIFGFLLWKHSRLFRRFTTGDVETDRNGAQTIDLEERTPMVKKATIAGDISFFELWSLAYNTPSGDMNKIHQVLLNLGIKCVNDKLPAPDIYELLCKWKDGTGKEQHVQLLQSAMKSADLERRWTDLCEERLKTDVKLSQVTLDQIIKDIQNPPKLKKFLRKLIPGQADNIDVHAPGNDPIFEATELLRRWRNGPFMENPNASLSLALERCGCSQVDRTFFAGMVSFYELWSLTRKMTGNEEETRDTLKKLGRDLEDGLTEDDIYFHLCTWKEANTSSNQGKLLRDALERANSEEAWRDIRELREKSKTPVSDQTLEHIVWHIQDPEKIGKFLQKLTLNDSETRLDISQGMKDIIKDTMGQLVKWKQQQFDENPIVLLSHALDKTACSPVDRSFFKVPFELMAGIIGIEAEWFVNSLTSRHIRTLAHCLDIDMNKETVNAINEANNDTIFNTEAMITDWIGQEECSNYEKRWRLKEAVERICRPDLTGHFQKVIPEIHVGVRKGTNSAAHPKGTKANLHLSDFMEDEFQRIATYLSAPQLRKLFGDSDDPLNTIRAFVEDLLAKNPKQDSREKLRKMLKSAGFKGLIPYTLGSNLYLYELVDVAFRLLLEDVYPLAEALGISGERLKNYRVDYTPDHLTQGTTAALIKFCKTNDNDRRKVREALSKAGYKDIAQILEYGHETSFADEFSVASRARMDEDVFVKISRNLGMSHTSSTETVLRDWKAMVHPPSYNERTCLADAVFPVLGAEVADAILSGQYREDGSESSAVIHTIGTAIESLELSLVQIILGVKDLKKRQDKLGITQSQGACPQEDQDERQPTCMTEELLTDGFTDSTSASFKRDHGESGKTETDMFREYKSLIILMIAQNLGVTVAKNWSAEESSIRQVLETWEGKIRKKPLSKDERRELSDKLLRAGFKQFAHEIMTGFIPSPRNKSKKKKTQVNNDKPTNQDNQDRRDDPEKHERRGESKKEKKQDKEDQNYVKQKQDEQDDNEKNEGRGKPSEHGKSTEPGN